MPGTTVPLKPKSKVPDYNPDREGWHKTKWTVTKATRNPELNAVEIDGKVMPFDKEFRFSVGDPGLAAAIREKYRWDVAVTRYNANSPADRGHRYIFTVPELPWHAEKEQGNGEQKDAQD